MDTTEIFSLMDELRDKDSRKSCFEDYQELEYLSQKITKIWAKYNTDQRKELLIRYLTQVIRKRSAKLDDLQGVLDWFVYNAWELDDIDD
jgi:hypothetical protein